MGDEKDNEEAGAKRQRLKGFFYETPPWAKRIFISILNGLHSLTLGPANKYEMSYLLTFTTQNIHTLPMIMNYTKGNRLQGHAQSKKKK